MTHLTHQNTHLLVAADKPDADLSPYFQTIFTGYELATQKLGGLTPDKSDKLTDLHIQIIDTVSRTILVRSLLN